MLKINERYELVFGALGNILAWYCFALFMPFLHILSKDFFPTGDTAITSIISFLAVSVGLFLRPVGASIFGPIGDRVGRQKALSLSVLLMAVPTFCIGLLPDYYQIGIFAPIILLFLRTFQGISMGGEFTTAMVHFVELSPNNKRGFFGSFVDAGAQVGVLLASGSLVILYMFFTEEQIYQYAWRYPFFGAGLLIPFAFIHPHKEPLPKKEKKDSVFNSLFVYKKEVLCTIAVTAFSAVSFYTLLTFLPYYLVREGILKLGEAAKCGVYANISVIFSAVFCGYLSDKFTRKPFLGSGIVGVVVTIYFIFIVGVQSVYTWNVVHIVYGFFVGMYFSGRAAFFSEAFPKNVRCTGVSVSMSIAQAIVGGSTSIIMNHCASISSTLSVVPITIVASLGLFALSIMQDRTGQDLR